MEAIQLIHDLNSTGRPASPEGQRVLARWSSWGAIPEVFDDLKPEWDAERAELRELLDDDEWEAAERTTINAHYTDPMIARQVWRLLDGLGFRGGTVLEPGSGAGTFIGLAPESAQMTGVELDPLTAAISAAVYPHATVRAESFADTRLPEGHFDAAIGNVPFSSVTLHDPVHNATRQSMHNHFIIKSLRLTRPGGLVAVLTSHYTMDTQNPGARREMNELADLVGAIRLPTGAHRRAAGTEVVTDLLVFRRRLPGKQMLDDAWETVSQVPIDGVPMRINRYFDEHPEQMLGEVGVGHGMYDANTLTITTDLAELETELSVAVDQLVFSARRAGLIMTERTAEQQARRVAFTPSAPELWDGSIVASESGDFRTVVEGGLEPLAVPRSAARELRALLRLRDSASRLLTAEAASVDDTPDIVLIRTTLRRDYLKYVGTYGALNRYTLRPTGRTNEEGEETFARIVPTAIRLLRSDPFGPLVLALEQFDDEDQSASPSAIMSHRVVVPRAEVQGVDSPADAIAVSLDRSGRIEITLVADLLGMNDRDAREALGTLVFTDPVTNQLIHAPEYLSGDVRAKLEAARLRAEDDPEFQVNVDALAEVLPAPLGIQDIHAKLGAVWISADVHERFLRSILRAPDVRVENPLPGMWEIRGGRQGLPSTSE